MPRSSKCSLSPRSPHHPCMHLPCLPYMPCAIAGCPMPHFSHRKFCLLKSEDCWPWSGLYCHAILSCCPLIIRFKPYICKTAYELIVWCWTKSLFAVNEAFAY
jgi:hypothetical protein